jgi:Zn-finger nucleic acid-binding protein
MEDFKPARPSDEFKPSRNEDEYFLKLDAELIKAHRARLDAERRQVELDHPWKCPKCRGSLVETTVQHVKVDVCESCKGMWLDAGEFEMITHVDQSSVSTFLGDILRGLRQK